MNEKNFNWDDLSLFLHVARGGGLSAGAATSRISPPTLGRRIAGLEEALGTQLFHRRARGYDLTEDGRALKGHAEKVEASVLDIQRWRDLRGSVRSVRLSAGTWISWFLARNLDMLRKPDDPFRLSLLATEARLDIARREADIGIRNQRPTEAWLAGQMIGQVAFATYAHGSGADRGWIVPRTRTASARWVRQTHGNDILLEASSPRIVLDMVRAGFGSAVLPCFVGDSFAELERTYPPIPELNHDQWLVMHHETRNDPPIRRVLQRIRDLRESHNDLFAGKA